MRFKEYLLEETTNATSDRHTVIEIAEAAKIFKEKCGSIDDFLYRVNSNPDIITKSKSTQRHRASLGGSAFIFEYLKSLPAWKKIPKRTESVFCSTSENITYPEGTPCFIFPFANCKLAMINHSDFNTYKIKIGDNFLSIPRMQIVISAFDHNKSNFKNGAGVVQKLHDLNLIENSPEYDEYFHGWMRKLISEEFVMHAPRELFNNIIKNNIPNSWQPDDLGIFSIKTKDLRTLRGKRNEVWFTGEYLSIPNASFNEFKAAVEEL